MRLFLLLLFVTGCFSFKFLVYNPLYGHSHTIFLSKIADALAEAGHEVTVLFPVVDEKLRNKTAIKSNARQILVEPEPKMRETIDEVWKGMLSNMWTMNKNPLKMLGVGRNFSFAHSLTCEAVVTNSALLEHLKAEKFDVGIAEPLSFCGFGLFDHLEIPSSIGALSRVYGDILSWYIGEPLAPSYVPAMNSPAGDKMGLLGRLKNGFGTLMGTFFVDSTLKNDAEVLTKVLGKDYTSIYGDLIGDLSFVFTNANPYLTYPRPLIHKTVEIGGITVDSGKVGDLGDKWNKILDERKHTVFISFGSVALSKDMPMEFKDSILSLCASLPEVTFIWKYEEPHNMPHNLPNLHLGSWLPQKALLADPRLSLFITHGGLGSTTEVAYLGKPAIMIPLFGDQMRNAAMLARHGGALTLDKSDLGNPEKLRETISTILVEPSFASNATKLAKMLQEQPVSAKDLVISHAEFVAKYGPLKQLSPYGRKLNILQYYLIDVIAFAIVSALIVVLGLLFIVRMVFRGICRLVSGDKGCKKEESLEINKKKKE